MLTALLACYKIFLFYQVHLSCLP